MAPQSTTPRTPAAAPTDSPTPSAAPAAADAATADRALKDRHRAMWASGDYRAVAHELIADLGPVLVRAAGVGPADRVLDVAAGTGNAAVPAARTGAHVVATDLAPTLLDQGRRDLDGTSLDLTWQEADAEALPFPDASFDVVLSCVGVMFAPHHETAAGELLRVTRPGGRIALLSWTPEGFIGQMFATMRPFMPPPPAGVQPPPRWGDEQHVRGLLDGGVSEVAATRRSLTVDRFAEPADFREYFKARYGPTIAAYRGLADEAGRAAELDAALDDLVRRFARPGTAAAMEWEYLLLVARRSG
jgi:SAM-dependent methyltransferase